MKKMLTRDSYHGISVESTARWSETKGETTMGTTMTRSTGIMVQINPDQPNDPSSRWTAFASSEGVAIGVFAGKSWKTERAACASARKWLDAQDAKHVQATRSGQWIPSTADDVLTH